MTQLIALYEEGCIMQLIPQWQHTFRQAKAMEHLDITGNVINAYDLESTLLQIEEQKKEIQRLENRLNTGSISPEDEKTLKTLLEDLKTGKIKIVPTDEWRQGEKQNAPQGQFVGSKNGNIYHYPNCTYAQNILPENQIRFANSEEARAHGYQPCTKCNHHEERRIEANYK